MKVNDNIDLLLVASPSPNPMIYYSFDEQGTPPLGLGYLATVLEQENYIVKIIDMAVPKITVNSLIQLINSNNPKIVGFSCTTETYLITIRLAKIVKDINADIFIVVGGPHVSFEYENVLSNDVIDMVVINEGENSLKKICDYFLRGLGTIEGLKGVAYKKNGLVVCTEPEPFIHDLDTLPIPNRLLFNDLNSYPIASTISSSRGCPGKCIFCAAGALSGGRYRFRSAKSIVEEIEYLISLGFNRVSFIDDTMTANLDRLNQFIEMLLDNDLHISWYCESRVDHLDRDILVKMKAAGLSNIQFGVESGNQGILDSIKKNITIQQIHDIFKWCNELEISASTNLIIGQPADDYNTIQDTLKIAGEITELGGLVNFSICTPFPGTPIWQTPDDFEIEVVYHDLDKYNLFCPVFNTKHLTIVDIRNAYFNAVTTYIKKYPNYNKVNLRVQETF
jgi:radical SAM superfamily enzyme YgiQ (UPF0313 family)